MIWSAYIDGSSNRSGGGAGLVVTGQGDFRLAYALRFDFKASNNKTKYEELIAALRIAKALWIQLLVVHSDSQLVVWQVSGNFEARELRMQQYLAMVKALSQ